MATTRAIIDVSINTSDAAAQLRNLQTQINSFNSALNKNNIVHAQASRQFADSIITATNASQAFTAEQVRMETSARRLDQTLAKGKGTIGQYFNAVYRKDSTEAASVLSLANARAQALETQFIKTSNAASGFRDAIAIRPIQALNDSTAVANERLAIHRTMLRQATTSMINFGKNTQWAGRQLMVGFTVPLTIFGTAAGKVFKEIDQAAVRFKKVYGDAFTTPEEIEQNMQAINALATEFTKYGIAVKDTITLAADAAASGAQNAELISATTQATRLATLGQMEQQEALSATISLQNAFRLSGEELAKSVNFLNMVENQTVVTLQDLAEAIPRVAPVIVGLGGNIEDMAAMLAAMQEGGVSAAQGANALKSGLGSLINPTKQATKSLAEMGINLNAIVQANRGDLMGTVQDFGRALAGLDQFTRQQALEEVFGKYQYARLGALFDNIIKDGTQAARVLQLAGMSAADMAKSAERELGVISEATSTKYMAAMERFKMSIAPIGEMFMKISTPIINFFSKILEMFDKLPDGAKNFLALATIITGVVVPAGTMFLGLLMNLIGTLIKFGHIVGVAVKGFGQGGFSGAIQAVSQSLNYMTLQEIDAASAAQQLGISTETANNALLEQVTRAGGATVAIDRLTQAYTMLIDRQMQTAALSDVIFGPSAAAATEARSGTRSTRIQRRNSGGPIHYLNSGNTVPGFGNTDTVPAMLTPGEFVVNKKATSSNLPLLHAINNGQKMSGFNKGGRIPGMQYFGPPFNKPGGGSVASLQDLLAEQARVSSLLGGSLPSQSERLSSGRSFQYLSEITDITVLEKIAKRMQSQFGQSVLQAYPSNVGLGKGTSAQKINKELKFGRASVSELEELTKIVDFYERTFTDVPGASSALTNLGLTPRKASEMMARALPSRLEKLRSKMMMGDPGLYSETRLAYSDAGLESVFDALIKEKGAIRYALPQELSSSLRGGGSGTIHGSALEREFGTGNIATDRDSSGRLIYIIKGSAIGSAKDVGIRPGLTENFPSFGYSYQNIAKDTRGLTRIHLAEAQPFNTGGPVPGVQYFGKNPGSIGPGGGEVLKGGLPIKILPSGSQGRKKLTSKEQQSLAEYGQTYHSEFDELVDDLISQGILPKYVKEDKIDWRKFTDENKKYKIGDRYISGDGSDLGVVSVKSSEKGLFGIKTGETIDVPLKESAVYKRDIKAIQGGHIDPSDSMIAAMFGVENQALNYLSNYKDLVMAAAASKNLDTEKLSSLLQYGKFSRSGKGLETPLALIHPRNLDEFSLYIEAIEALEKYQLTEDADEKLKTQYSNFHEKVPKRRSGTKLKDIFLPLAKSIFSRRISGKFGGIDPKIINANSGGLIPGLQYFANAGQVVRPNIEQITSGIRQRQAQVSIAKGRSLSDLIFNRGEDGKLNLDAFDLFTLLKHNPNLTDTEISQISKYHGSRIRDGIFGKYDPKLGYKVRDPKASAWRSIATLLEERGHPVIQKRNNGGLISNLQYFANAGQVLNYGKTSSMRAGLPLAMAGRRQRVLVDLDSTIFDNPGGNLWNLKPEDFTGIQKNIDRVYELRANGIDVEFVTARPPQLTELTQETLKRFGLDNIPVTYNDMKTAGKRDPNKMVGMPAPEYKLAVAKKRMKEGYDVSLLDDDENNRKLMAENEIYSFFNKGGLTPGVQYFSNGGDVAATKAFATRPLFQSANKTMVPGYGNTDTVPAALTPGEFVINKKATANNLPLLQAINSGNIVRANTGGLIPGVQYLMRGDQLQKIMGSLEPGNLRRYLTGNNLIDDLTPEQISLVDRFDGVTDTSPISRMVSSDIKRMFEEGSSFEEIEKILQIAGTQKASSMLGSTSREDLKRFSARFNGSNPITDYNNLRTMYQNNPMNDEDRAWFLSEILLPALQRRDVKGYNSGGIIPSVQYLMSGNIVKSAIQKLQTSGFSSLSPSERALLSSATQNVEGTLFRGVNAASDLVPEQIRSAILRNPDDLGSLLGTDIKIPSGSWSENKGTATSHVINNSSIQKRINKLNEIIYGYRGSYAGKTPDEVIELDIRKHEQDRLMRLSRLEKAKEDLDKFELENLSLINSPNTVRGRAGLIAERDQKSRAYEGLQREYDRDFAVPYDATEKRAAAKELKEITSRGGQYPIVIKATTGDQSIPPGSARVVSARKDDRGIVQIELSTSSISSVPVSKIAPETVMPGKGNTALNEQEHFIFNSGGRVPALFRNSGGSIFESPTQKVPGYGNTDTVPAMLTPGEFVINKKATAENLPLIHAINDGKVSGMMNGGYINSSSKLADGIQKFYTGGYVRKWKNQSGEGFYIYDGADKAIRDANTGRPLSFSTEEEALVSLKEYREKVSARYRSLMGKDLSNSEATLYPGRISQDRNEETGKMGKWIIVDNEGNEISRHQTQQAAQEGLAKFRQESRKTTLASAKTFLTGKQKATMLVSMAGLGLLSGTVGTIVGINRVKRDEFIGQSNVTVKDVNPQEWTYLNRGNIVPGSGNTDTVPAMLTPGEFVVNKGATSDNLPLLHAINNGNYIKANSGGLIPGIQYLAMGGMAKMMAAQLGIGLAGGMGGAAIGGAMGGDTGAMIGGFAGSIIPGLLMPKSLGGLLGKGIAGGGAMKGLSAALINPVTGPIALLVASIIGATYTFHKLSESNNKEFEAGRRLADAMTTTSSEIDALGTSAKKRAESMEAYLSQEEDDFIEAKYNKKISKAKTEAEKKRLEEEKKTAMELAGGKKIISKSIDEFYMGQIKQSKQGQVVPSYLNQSQIPQPKTKQFYDIRNRLLGTRFATAGPQVKDNGFGKSFIEGAGKEQFESLKAMLDIPTQFARGEVSSAQMASTLAAGRAAYGDNGLTTRGISEKDFASKLSQYILSGVMTQDQASSVAAAIGEEIKDSGFGERVANEVISNVGAEGRRVEIDPGGVARKLAEQNQKRVDEYQKNIEKNMPQFFAPETFGKNAGNVSTAQGILSAYSGPLGLFASQAGIDLNRTAERDRYLQERQQRGQGAPTIEDMSQWRETFFTSFFSGMADQLRRDMGGFLEANVSNIQMLEENISAVQIRYNDLISKATTLQDKERLRYEQAAALANLDEKRLKAEEQMFAFFGGREGYNQQVNQAMAAQQETLGYKVNYAQDLAREKFGQAMALPVGMNDIPGSIMNIAEKAAYGLTVLGGNLTNGISNMFGSVGDWINTTGFGEGLKVGEIFAEKLGEGFTKKFEGSQVGINVETLKAYYDEIGIATGESMDSQLYFIRQLAMHNEQAATTLSGMLVQAGAELQAASLASGPKAPGEYALSESQVKINEAKLQQLSTGQIGGRSISTEAAVNISTMYPQIGLENLMKFYDTMVGLGDVGPQAAERLSSAMAQAGGAINMTNANGTKMFDTLLKNKNILSDDTMFKDFVAGAQFMSAQVDVVREAIEDFAKSSGKTVDEVAADFGKLIRIKDPKQFDKNIKTITTSLNKMKSEIKTSSTMKGNLKDLDYMSNVLTKISKIKNIKKRAALEAKIDPQMQILMDLMDQFQRAPNVTIKTQILEQIIEVQKTIGQEVTAVADQPEEKKATGGGTKEDPLGEQMRLLRDRINTQAKIGSVIEATGQKAKSIFARLRSLNLTEGIMEYFKSLDPKTAIKVGEEVLKSRGKLNTLLSLMSQEAVTAQQEAAASAKNNAKFAKTMSNAKAFSGLSTVQMAGAFQDQEFVAGLQRVTAGAKNKKESNRLAREYAKNYISVQQSNLAAQAATAPTQLRAEASMNTFGYQGQVGLQQTLGLTQEEASMAMQNQQVQTLLENLMRNGKSISDLSAKERAAVLDFINSQKTVVGEFNKALGDVEEGLTAVNTILQDANAYIDEYNIKPLQKQLDSLSESSANYQEENRRLSNALSDIQDKEEAIREAAQEKEKAINDAYTERVQALEDIQRANNIISAQQKGQLDVASALSRGDIGAAAQAALAMQQTMAQQRQDEVKTSLSRQRDDELEAIRLDTENKIKNIAVEYNGQLLNREQIEKRIKDNNDRIYQNSLKQWDLEKLISAEREKQQKISDQQANIERAQTVAQRLSVATQEDAGKRADEIALAISGLRLQNTQEATTFADYLQSNKDMLNKLDQTEFTNTIRNQAAQYFQQTSQTVGADITSLVDLIKLPVIDTAKGLAEIEGTTVFQKLTTDLDNVINTYLKTNPFQKMMDGWDKFMSAVEGKIRSAIPAEPGTGGGAKTTPLPGGDLDKNKEINLPSGVSVDVTTQAKRNRAITTKQESLTINGQVFKVTRYFDASGKEIQESVKYELQRTNLSPQGINRPGSFQEVGLTETSQYLDQQGMREVGVNRLLGAASPGRTTAIPLDANDRRAVIGGGSSKPIDPSITQPIGQGIIEGIAAGALVFIGSGGNPLAAAIAASFGQSLLDGFIIKSPSQHPLVIDTGHGITEGISKAMTDPSKIIVPTNLASMFALKIKMALGMLAGTTNEQFTSIGMSIIQSIVKAMSLPIPVLPTDTMMLTSMVSKIKTVFGILGTNSSNEQILAIGRGIIGMAPGNPGGILQGITQALNDKTLPEKLKIPISAFIAQINKIILPEQKDAEKDENSLFSTGKKMFAQLTSGFANNFDKKALGQTIMKLKEIATPFQKNFNEQLLGTPDTLGNEKNSYFKTGQDIVGQLIAGLQAKLGDLNAVIANINASVSKINSLNSSEKGQGNAFGGFISRAFGGNINYKGSNQRPPGMAFGSFVPGIGNSDKVPAMLTPGEFVVRKPVAQAYRSQLEALNGQVNPQAGQQVYPGVPTRYRSNGIDSLVSVGSMSTFSPLTDLSNVSTSVIDTSSINANTFPIVNTSNDNQYSVDSTNVSNQNVLNSFSPVQYTYNVSVNAKTGANANDIAQAISSKLAQRDQRSIRGTKLNG